jgi:hypothetical protein
MHDGTIQDTIGATLTAPGAAPAGSDMRERGWLKRTLRPALVGIPLLGLVGGFTA